MFLSKLDEKEKYKFMDLALYMANIDGPSPKEEERLINVMFAELGAFDTQYHFNGSKEKEDLDSTIEFFQNTNSMVKRIVFLNLINISFIDDVYNTEEHFFLEKVQKALDISFETRKKLVQVVYANRDVREMAKRILSE